MMEKLVVGIAQWLPPDSSVDNLDGAVACIDGLASRGSELVVLPGPWPVDLYPVTLRAFHLDVLM